MRIRFVIPLACALILCGADLAVAEHGMSPELIVSAQDMDEFLEAVWRRQQPHSPWGSLERLKGRLRLLGILNDFLEHAVLDVRELVQLYWKNRSLQEFFAGLWLARYAPEEDHDWIARSIYQPVYEQGRRGEDQRGSLYWMWRFAAEMPEEGRRWKCWLSIARSAT